MLDALAALSPATFIGSPDAIEWTELEGRDGQIRTKFFGENREVGPWVLLVSFAPGYSEPAHWHDFDTVYIPVKGEMIIEGEGVLRAGDVRWVRGGTYYGPETAGAEGCEFWLVGYGPPGLHHERPGEEK